MTSLFFFFISPEFKPLFYKGTPVVAWRKMHITNDSVESGQRLVNLLLSAFFSAWSSHKPMATLPEFILAGLLPLLFWGGEKQNIFFLFKSC